MEYFDLMHREIKKILIDRLKSLKNDYKRSSYPMKNRKIQTAPFPITMYSMSILDLFSSYEAGWNEQNKEMGRFQTDRMIRYLKKYMGYDLVASRILMQIHRHQLMHTSAPRLVRDKKTGDVYTWEISDNKPGHMTLEKIAYGDQNISSVYVLKFNIKNFIKDLESAAKKYLKLLKKNPTLIDKFLTCKEEIKIKDLDFGNYS